MSPEGGAASPSASSGGGVRRAAAIGALAIVVLIVLYVLVFGGDGGTQYRLQMQTGGQLVKGNQVLIGGVPVGTVDEVKLIDSGQAEVSITVDRELHEGTEAITRATSLSGIANRYISIQPGPDNAPVLPNDSVIAQVDTTSPVDLDQLFNTLREPERKGLQDIIQGSATAYAGRAEEANETYKYLSPSLVATDRLFVELTRDERVLTDFLVSGANVVSAVAERRDDLSALTQNANQALGAIARQNDSFDRALVALPPTLRQANTTFFNLRDALDDLDPFLAATKENTKDLPPFLSQLTGVAKKGVPVFKNLRLSVRRKGKSNDFADATADLVPLQQQARGAFPAAVAAMQKGDDTLRFLRPYAPDILNTVAGLNRAAGYYDADGHYVRAAPAGTSVFRFAGTGLDLDPIPVSAIFTDYGALGTANNRVRRRCPGGATQAIAGSNPFSSPPFLAPPAGAPATPLDCNVLDVPNGP